MVLRVVIADDEALVRAGFRMILEAQPDIEVVGEAADGREAIELVGRLAPDVVLMDIRMPTLDGLAATREIVAGAAIGVHVLILTTFDLDEYVYESLKAGASGFLLKTAPPAELAAAVRAVAGGDVLLSPTITRRLIQEFVGRPRRETDAPDWLAQLTERERDVLREVARGLSNREIAEALVVSESTVKTHVNRILSKLDLRDRVQAVVLAYESGFLAPSG
jgi:DNA-binding NarL/FixJ family response regulator